MPSHHHSERILGCSHMANGSDNTRELMGSVEKIIYRKITQMNHSLGFFSPRFTSLTPASEINLFFLHLHGYLPTIGFQKYSKTDQRSFFLIEHRHLQMFDQRKF